MGIRSFSASSHVNTSTLVVSRDSVKKILAANGHAVKILEIPAQG